MAQKKVKEEKQHHREAFELYYVLPEDKRSIREVARQLGKAPSTIQCWADSFNWKERVEIRDANVKRQFKEIQKQNDDTLVSIKASFHKILKVMIANAIEDIKKGKLRVDNVNELVRIMELDLKLLGEDDRQAQNNFNAVVEALKTSAEMFGMDMSGVEYDGNDRPEGDEDEDDSEED
ncbi:terminase small subunit [Bacillus phage 031MP004]|nr:terminase small subunit [Bacillus phage 022DV001]QFG05401.1 terminase small subunit [Bacillus phage 031MP003]QFG05492.1 terminase small subunit [Bacillus phage 031MP002]QFG05579.1 terminase small subunit [Bacillus phage 031MP004]QFG05754.1 terminase small subunit [Bacillus phage 055SW001]